MAPFDQKSIDLDGDKVDPHASEQLEHVAPAQAASQQTVWQELKTVRPLFLRLLILYISVVSIGMDNGLAGFVIGIPAFRRQFGSLMNEEVGYVIKATYTSAWGAAGVGMQTVGAILSGYLADKIGRRWSIRIAASVVVVAAALMVASRHIGMLIASKGLLGLGTGFSVSQSGPYLAESSTPRLRGIAIVGISVAMVFGQWLSSMVIWATGTAYPDINDNTSWLLPFGLQLVFPIAFLALSVFLPESPVYLAQKGRIEEAEGAARVLFSDAYDYRGHVSKVRLEIEAENEHAGNKSSITYWETLRGVDLRRTLIGIVVIIGQVVSGNLFILGFQNYFYELAGLSNSNALTAGSMSTALAANFLSIFLIDWVGRRPLYVYGTLMLAIANLLVGFMSLLQPSNPGVAGNVSVFGFYLWQFVYQCTIGPVAWAVSGEIPSNRLRAKTNSVINLCNSLFSFAMSFAIPQMFNPDAGNLGLKMGYVFGSTSAVLFITVWLFLPETKNRTAWELDRLFEAKVPARRFKTTKFDEMSQIIPSAGTKVTLA